MKELLVLVLVTVTSNQVACLPYQSKDGYCHDPTTQYHLDDSELCCSRCPPGKRLKQICSKTSDTVCQPCQRNQFIEDWNYSPNCFVCSKCSERNGLQFAQNCTTTSRSICKCKRDMYCTVGFGEHSNCSECKRYSLCKPGHGVSEPGTASSDVTCAPCPEQTFSNKSSRNEACKPHTNCAEGAVVRAGNATSDTMCKRVVLSHTTPVLVHPPQDSSVSTAAGQKGKEGNMSTPIPPSSSELPGNAGDPWTKSPLAEPGPGADRVQDTSVSTAAGQKGKEGNISLPTLPSSSVSGPGAVAASAIAFVLLVLFAVVVVAMLVRCRARQGKGKACLTAGGSRGRGLWLPRAPPPERLLPPRVDANGNTEPVYKGHSVDTQLTPISVLEHHGLLEAGEPRPRSHQGEPSPLQAEEEDLVSQPRQPTSPPANGAHVNVNITVHIENGHCFAPAGTGPLLPPEAAAEEEKEEEEEEEEEEFLSVPQQEAGKQYVVAQQESDG